MPSPSISDNFTFFLFFWFFDFLGSVFLKKLILNEGFRASRYYHEQDRGERFLMVVFSSNLDKTKGGS